MNGYLWRVLWVTPTSEFLVDRTGDLTVATTDSKTRCVYLSNNLSGEFLTTVLLHELGHVVMISYDMLDDIHKAVYPEKWVEAEEWVCNFIAHYGRVIFNTAYKLLGDDAWKVVPRELERFVA